MFYFPGLCFGSLVRLFRSRLSLLLENPVRLSTARRAQEAPSARKAGFVRQMAEGQDLCLQNEASSERILREKEEE